ncbi:MAG: NAD(P)/FAD-dependent oxidoreductase [Deltaproteobacteria bacterium]|nr:NAD(P)/FAD-dependent oxidoreductase [Deltaproteobacteria bacterium]
MSAGRDLYDLTILGAGPTGLYAAYYAGRRGLRTKLVDSLAELGGQITALYPEKWIFDVAGHAKIIGKDLVRNLVVQAMEARPTVCLEEQVTGLEDLGGGLLGLRTNKAEHSTRTLLIAIGIGMFTPKPFPSPEINAYLGRGVVYSVREKEAYRDKRLLIVGGGDSAVDWALNLEPYCRQITLIHRRDGFRAHEESVRQLKASTVEVKVFYELKAVRGEPTVQEAVIFHNKMKAEEVLPVDAVLGCLGFSSKLGPVKEWGLTLDDDSIVVNSRMETNRPGVYAAGDITTYPGKVKLIAIGFGEAAIAVNHIAHYLNPAVDPFPGYTAAPELAPARAF